MKDGLILTETTAIRLEGGDAIQMPTFYTRFVKRWIDIIASVAGMILCSPLMIIIYIAIKLDDGGNAIYSQERIGYLGRPFVIYKFRSMIPCAEKGVPRLCSRNDRRLTRVGTFLRAYHLDELPQLWNVLKGELSLVGPRPERRHFIEIVSRIDLRYERLYRLRPGLFSMATLYNGYTDTIDKMLLRLEMDLEYLENNSIMVDMKIIVHTVTAILSGKRF